MIRISGPKTAKALDRMAVSLPVPRKLTRAALRDPSSDELLDDALVVWFPAPHSFTGEDVAELYIHGGRAVLEGVLYWLSMNSQSPLNNPYSGGTSRTPNAHYSVPTSEGKVLHVAPASASV